MHNIYEGIQRFRTTYYCEQEQRFKELASGQKPQALFITCADSRIDPNALTQLPPGELFILRNAGNLVPEYGKVWGGEAATIEYAVAVLKIPQIVICGHSNCGAMAALMQPEPPKGLEAVGYWLDHAKRTQAICRDKYKEESDPAKLCGHAIHENVVVQLDNLLTHPVVAKAVEAGELSLHGWVYDIPTGDVEEYNSETGQFEWLSTNAAAATH